MHLICTNMSLHPAWRVVEVERAGRGLPVAPVGQSGHYPDAGRRISELNSPRLVTPVSARVTTRSR